MYPAQHAAAPRASATPTGSRPAASIPSRAAARLGAKAAQAVIARHLQDHGDYPRGLVVDLWGSATMRTAGEDFAMALALLGVRPVWDPDSGRVAGIEILPIAELDHPRIDVTLRVSGLFRDVFPTLSALAEGYDVFVVTDASGTFNETVQQAAWARMTAAGAQLMNWFSVACELHRDWRNDIEGLGALLSNHIPNYRNLMTSYAKLAAK